MITLTVKDITGETVLLEKQLSHTSIQDGQVACFLQEIEYAAIPLSKNALYKASVAHDGTVALAEQTVEFLGRQFNISTWERDGETLEGVTNNTLLFRLFG